MSLAPLIAVSRVRIPRNGKTPARFRGNQQIVERLQFLQQMRAHARMLDFNVGDRVSFSPDGRPALFGVLVRYNKKTVTVITEGGEHWNVAPGFLRKLEDVTSAAKGESADPNVERLPRK